MTSARDMTSVEKPDPSSDVDDVLSSIRRLVLEEERKAPKTAPLISEDDVNLDEALVLTPQDRVEEPPSPRRLTPVVQETETAVSAEDRVLEEVEGRIDEEVLKGLVADVLRQELQGSLGERITRNVRKLVRQEVRLALAAQSKGKNG